MGNLTIAMALGFLMTFFLYVGSERPDGTHAFASGFLQFVENFNDPSVSIIDNIINTVLTPSVLIGGAITGIVASLTGFSLTFIIPAVMVGAIANFVLFPTTILNSLGMPTEINWLLISFFQIILIVGYLAFIGGRDP